MTVNTNPNFNIPVIRPWADSNSYSAPAYWIAEQRPNQLSHSRAQKIGWAAEFSIHSLMVQDFKFEDNSTELFSRVTVM